MLESHLMEETYNKWPEWQKVYFDIKKKLSQGIVCLCPGNIYTFKNIKKNMYTVKSDFKEICLKLATNRQSDKAFLFTS